MKRLLCLSPLVVILACGPQASDPQGEQKCEAALFAGDLVITEIMANPPGEDQGNEYFEVFNPADSPVDLNGLEISSSKEDGSDSKAAMLDDVVIQPKQYLVLGGVMPEFKPAYVDYGYRNGIGNLRNSSGMITLRCGDVEVDSVTYGEADDGHSLGFDGNLTPDHIANDDLENFCEASTEFTRDYFGSPGAANEPCSIVTQETCLDGGTMRDVVRPGEGDLVITEVMPDPQSPLTDDSGEWFEIVATADVDLNGLVAGNDVGDPKVNVLAEECLTLAAGSYAVFARSDLAEENGGLPDPVSTFSFGLTNGGDTLYVGVGETVVDQVSWSGSSAGRSIALDPALTSATDNDDEENWCNGTSDYSAENRGTPGTANLPCDLSGMCMDGAALRPVNSPVAADVTITEFHPNPDAVGDTVGEFFEVHFASAVDLNGLDFGRNADPDLDIDYSISEVQCLSIPGDSYIIFVRNTDSAMNGGLPAPNGTPATNIFDADMALSQTGGTDYTVFVSVDGNLLDIATYNGSDISAGISRQKDPDSDVFCDTPIGTTYGAGDRGSPGLANEQCP